MLGLLAVLALAVAAFSWLRRPAAESPAAAPIAAAPATVSIAAPVARPEATDKSVAVLAFANMSDEKANEYFSDGISEEILNVLGKVPGLKVTARTSAVYFKGRNVPAPEIARQLGVSHLVAGTVCKAGNEVRVSARLISAADGKQVWGDDFRAEWKAGFALQDQIAARIAQNLQLKLGVVSARNTRVDPEALRLYLQGRQFWNLRTDEALDRAESLFRQAMRLDPSVAQARSGLADVWLSRGSNRPDPATRLGNFSDRASPQIQRVIAEAEAALVQDPSLAEAHATIGNALSSAWDAPGALRSLRRAVELNPNYASAHHWLGRVFLCDGRMAEGLAALARAVELDPLSPIILDNYGMALLFAGRPADALPVVERGLLLRPNHQRTLAWKTWALTDLGRKDEALKLARQAELTPAEGNDMAFAAAHALRQAGGVEEAEALARTLAGYRRFLATAGSGRPADALQLLDPPSLSNLFIHYLLFLPALNPVRSDPRFAAALTTLGLTEAHTRAQAWRAAHPQTS